MIRLESYIGITPFTVNVDKSDRLERLTMEAQSARGLNFEKKLERIKEITHRAISSNAIELWRSEGNEVAKDIVINQHPLSKALEEQIGCCRYQGALFFVLGFEAHLGERHFLQAAPVTSAANSVFNQIVQDGKTHTISIYTESLKDKSFDYTVQNPNVYDSPFKRLPGFNMYSYHSTPEGPVLVSNEAEHALSLE